MLRSFPAALFTALCLVCGAAPAATFNYHGVLQDAGKPAQGDYDLELTLYSAPEGGRVIAGPLTMYKVAVHEGHFSAEAAFPALTDAPAQAWLGVRVRGAAASGFTDLSARAPVGADAVAASVCPGAWVVGGNSGTSPPGDYLGTGDGKPLVFAVNATEAGRITPGQGVAFSQNGLFGAFASGKDAFATGEYALAQGTGSFAAGSNAQVAQNGSYMWGDASASPAFTATTAANQYVIRAAGGAAINGAPKTGSTELSIFPGGASDTSANVFLGGRNTAGGINVSTVQPSNATNNDAQLFISQYDGNASDTRTLLYAGHNGVGINTALGPIAGTASGAELTIGSSLGYGHETWIELLSAQSAAVAFQGINFAAKPSGGFSIRQIIAHNSAEEFQTAIDFVPAEGFLSTYGIGFFRNGVANGVFQVGTDTVSGNGAFLSADGQWTNASSRTFKENFAHVDALDVLARLVAMPVQSWFYKGDHSGGRHMGPVAEEFAQAFGLGNNEKYLGTVDEGGVALAAIQGLNEKLERDNADQAAQIADLHERVAALAARLATLESAGSK